MTRPHAQLRLPAARPARVARATALPLALVVLHLASCGGTAGLPAPASRAESAAPEYRTVDEAQRALAKAERDLMAATMPAPAFPAATGNAQGYGQPSSTVAPGGGAPAPTAPPPPPAQASPPKAEAPPAPSADKKSDEERGTIAADQDKAAERATSPCELACRAFASMKKASDALCRLAGTSDARCTDAQRRVSDSAARVASCGCRDDAR